MQCSSILKLLERMLCLCQFLLYGQQMQVKWLAKVDVDKVSQRRPQAHRGRYKCKQWTPGSLSFPLWAWEWG